MSMAQGRNNLSIADARHLFEGLAGFHPQSAKELKDRYRAWMKAHHPDITGNRDPLSMEAVQWMNAAYDVLRTQDWTKATADTAPEWTDVDEEGKWKEQEKRERAAAAKRYRQQQAKTKQEEEQEHQRRMREVKRRVEALKKRPLWQKILWGSGNAAFGDEGLSNPGVKWCCLNLFGVMLGLGFPVGFGVICLNIIISSVTTHPPFLFYWSDFGILWAIACVILLGSMWVSWLVNPPKKKRRPKSELFYFLGFICVLLCSILIARVVDHQPTIAQAANQAVIHPPPSNRPPSNTQDTNTSNWPTTYSPYSPQCKDGKFTQGFFEAYNAVCSRKGDGAWTPPVTAPDPSGTSAPSPSGTSMCQPPRRMTARDGCQ
jgi:hypothetical protein